MAKGKKRKAPMAAQDRKREEPANLFERISNKKRFNILGRKVKGDTRQVGKLRSEATERVRRSAARTFASVAFMTDLQLLVVVCSAKTPSWWSTASYARAMPSLTADLGVRVPAAASGTQPVAHPSVQLGLDCESHSGLLLRSACLQRTTRA